MRRSALIARAPRRLGLTLLVRVKTSIGHVAWDRVGDASSQPVMTGVTIHPPSINGAACPTLSQANGNER